MSKRSKKELELAKIVFNQKLKELSDALNVCTEMADKYNFEFSSPITADGMSGTYYGLTNNGSWTPDIDPSDYNQNWDSSSC